MGSLRCASWTLKDSMGPSEQNIGGPWDSQVHLVGSVKLVKLIYVLDYRPKLNLI